MPARGMPVYFVPMTTEQVDSPATAALLRKVTWRLLPFVIVCYLFNYIDRINVSLAKLPMSRDPKLPGFEKYFGLGMALFFIGYCTFEVPSNLLQQRFGARRWIARIMISWGIISTCFLFIRGPWSFYLLRILLGFAEAGFFPGMILYLSFWIPSHHRARAAAILLTSTAIAGVIGNPVGGTILYYAEKLPNGLVPWQYLFLFEGIPTICLGLLTLFVLTDKPKDAKWLNDAEREHLQALLERDRTTHVAPHLADFKHAFTSPQVWILALLYGLHSFGFYAINFWTPTLIHDALTSAGSITEKTPRPLADLKVALLSAIPFGAAAIGMVLIGRSSDKHKNRRGHLIFALILDTVGLALAALAPMLLPNNATFLTILGLSIAAIGAFGAFGPFWSLPNSLLVGTAAATGVALINSIGNFCGGFIGPQVIQGDLQRGLFIAAGLALVATVLTRLMPLRLERTEAAGAT